jgi:branched-chain amino acid transport system permease protein
MDYVLHILVICCIYVLLACGLNVAVGLAGVLSLGQAGFYAIGAYASALLALRLSAPFWVSMPAAALAAALAAQLVGLVSLRLRGDYLALATLAFSEAVRIVARNSEFTGGSDGLPGIPPPVILSVRLATPATFLPLAMAVTVISLAALAAIAHSPFGRALLAIHQDEVAASVLGIDPTRHRRQALVLSALFAGLAGSLYGHYVTYVDPSSFTVSESVLVLCAVVLGGLGSTRGAALGAATLVLIPELFRFLHLPTEVAASTRVLLYGAGLVAVIIFRPRGLMGRMEVR